MKNDERAPDVVLTDAEREALHSPTLCDCDDLMGCPHLAALYADVGRIVAARTADAAARLVAVEALHYRCGQDDPDYSPRGYCHECVLDWPCATIRALYATAPDADCRCTRMHPDTACQTHAPDAGQREAQERSVTEWGVRWHSSKGTSIPTGTVRTRDPGEWPYKSEDDARHDCPPGAHVVSRQRITFPDVVTAWTRADRSPEQP